MAFTAVNFKMSKTLFKHNSYSFFYPEHFHYTSLNEDELKQVFMTASYGMKGVAPDTVSLGRLRP